MRYSDLMALAEASTGFNGGTAVDYMPHLSLSEAAGMFPVAMCECYIECNDMDSQLNESLVEAALSGMSADSMNESVWSTIKEKVIKIFKKIKEFVMSIIHKLKMQIDKLRLSGNAFYTRYKNDPGFKDKDWKDMKFNGYPFANASIFNDTTSMKPDELAKTFGWEWTKPADGGTYTEDEIGKIEDLDMAEGKSKIAKTLVTIDSLGTDWASDIRKEAYGEKKELSYGSDGFDRSTIISLLQEVPGLDKIKNSYEKLLSAVKTDEKKLTTAADKYGKEFDDKVAKGKITEADKEKSNESRVQKAFSKYLAVYQSITATIGAVKKIHVDYETARVNQAKAMMVKMISYKEPKSDKNDFELAEFADFDFEV